MKQVYSAANNIEAQMVKDYLQSAGVDCIVKGDLLGGAIGELPADTCPTLWIMDPDDEDRAKKLIENYESRHPSDQIFQHPWTCGKCGERIDAQFTQCWHCGTDHLLDSQ